MRSLKYGRVLVERPKPSMEYDTEEPCAVFRAQDGLALEALRAYYTAVVAANAAPSIIGTAAAAIEDFTAWQAHHPRRVKLPD